MSKLIEHFKYYILSLKTLYGDKWILNMIIDLVFKILLFPIDLFCWFIDFVIFRER